MWGELATAPAAERPDLLAAPVADALAGWPGGIDARVAAIDPELADTATFCAAYRVPTEVSANCVVVAAKRAGEVRYAACVILATTRADVNGVVRRQLAARKASFAAMDDAVARTGMAYGGITPFGLPAEWSLLVDQRVADTPYVVVGSGVRHSKLVVSGAALPALPGAVVLADLAQPVS